MFAVFAGAGFAHADTIQVANAGFADSDTDGNFEFRYSAALVNVPPSEIKQNDFFVIFDFEGYTGEGFQPVDWTRAYVNTAFPTTFEPLITNDPGIGDLVFTYVGSSDIETAGLLGLFGGETTEKFFHLDGFMGRDHNNVQPGNPPQSNFGTVFVPTADTIGGTPVPLPAAAWGGMALFGLLGGARLKKSALARA